MLHLPGGNKGTQHVDLGKNPITTDSATLEFWFTPQANTVWCRMFSLGADIRNAIAFTPFCYTAGGYSLIGITPDGGDWQLGTLSVGTQYYFAIVFDYNNESGATTVKAYCVDVSTGWPQSPAPVTQTLNNWKLTEKITQNYFVLGYSFGNDPDARMDYDEVRIWKVALDESQLSANYTNGPDKIFEDTNSNSDVVTATWNGADTSASTSGNWLCYDDNSAIINNALPSSGTDVKVDSNNPAPSVDSTIFWNKLYLGSTSGTSGAISFSGDAEAQFTELYIGSNGSGSITIGGNASVTVSGYSSLGNSSGSSGTVTQTGGTVTTGTDGNGFNIGCNGTGTYNLSGGTLKLNQVLRIGWGNSSSENKFNMTGGTLDLAGKNLVVGDWAQNNEFNITSGNVINGYNLYVGSYTPDSTGSGTVTQDGGGIAFAQPIILGYQKGNGKYIMNSGTITEDWWLTIGSGGTGEFTQNNGTVTLGVKGSSWLCIAEKNNANGTYVINDGTLEVKAGGIMFGNGGIGGTGRFEMNGGTVITPVIKYVKGTATTVLNGGTLRAKASNAAFLDSLGTVTVGGVTIDTTSSAYALGVTSGTTLKATPDATKPAITLAGSGTLDLSGTLVDFSATPSSNVYVLAKTAEGSTATFAAAPASPTLNGVSLAGWKVSLSADGKSIRVVRKGTMVVVY